MNNFNPFGEDLFGEPIKPEASGLMAQRFLVPPFSVLNAREGDWQTRKAAWLALGIKSELGRSGQQASPSDPAMPAADYSKGERGDGAGKPIPTSKKLRSTNYSGPEYAQGRGNNEGGSIFDPVLCELSYKWFAPKGGQIIDPFAGGSVRGIVASLLGFNYWGCDIRKEQIEANQAQSGLCDHIKPTWVCGDSLEKMAEAPEADLVFSCPPYGGLEIYSDDPKDISTMDWPDFLNVYRGIIQAACARLKENRFAAFVVGDFRRDNGAYHNFVGETINAFTDCGLHLYNEIVLLTAIGSLPVRAGRQFASGRKVGKAHQNVLVFWKGNPAKAADTIRQWPIGECVTLNQEPEEALPAQEPAALALQPAAVVLEAEKQPEPAAAPTCPRCGVKLQGGVCLNYGCENSPLEPAPVATVMPPAPAPSVVEPPPAEKPAATGKMDDKWSNYWKERGIQKNVITE